MIECASITESNDNNNDLVTYILCVDTEPVLVRDVSKSHTLTGYNAYLDTSGTNCLHTCE